MDTRGKLLEAASESCRSDIVSQIIEEISRHDFETRDDLGDGLASEVVSRCRSKSAAKRIQSVLVSACIVEATKVYHNGESVASDLLLSLCEALSELLLSHPGIFDVSRKIFEEAFLAQTSQLVTGANLSRSAFSSVIIVDAFREVARFPETYAGVNPDISIPAILYAHEVYDIATETSSDENVHRQIIESYALFVDGNRIDPELFQHSQSMMNGITSDQFHTSVAPILRDNLENIKTTRAAMACLQSCSMLIELLILCGKNRYLEHHLTDDGVVSIMVDTSMELMIEMKTEEATVTVFNLLNSTVKACPGWGLVIVSEALVEAMNVDASIFADSQECQRFLKEVTICLHQVAKAGLEFVDPNEKTNDDAFKEELLRTAAEIIQILRVMGEESNADALRTWEEVYILFGGEIDNVRTRGLISTFSDAVHSMTVYNPNEDEDEIEGSSNREENYDYPGVTEISESPINRAETLDESPRMPGLVAAKNTCVSNKMPHHTHEGDMSIEDRIHAKLKAANTSAASDDEMDREIPSETSSHDSASNASRRDIDHLSDSDVGSQSSNGPEVEATRRPAQVPHHTHEGAMSIEDRIHAKLKAANTSAASDDEMDREIPSETSSHDSASNTSRRDIDYLSDSDVSSQSSNGPGVEATRRPAQIKHDTYEGAMSIEDIIHAKLRAANTSAASDDELDRKMQADSSSSELQNSDSYARGNSDAGSQSIRNVQKSRKHNINQTFKSSVAGSDFHYSDSSQSKPLDSQDSLFASDLFRESMRVGDIESRINAKLNGDDQNSRNSLTDSVKNPLHGINYTTSADSSLCSRTSKNETQRGYISSVAVKSDVSIEHRIRSKLTEQERNASVGEISQNGAQRSSATSGNEFHNTGLDERINSKLNPSYKRSMDRNKAASAFDNSSQESESGVNRQHERISSDLHPSSRSINKHADTMTRESTVLLTREANESRERPRKNASTSDSEMWALLDDDEILISCDSSSALETEYTQEIGSSSQGDKASNEEIEDIVVAMAIEEGEADDLDEALNYDPKSKKKLGKTINRWTVVAIIAAVVVAVILIVLLSRKKLKENEDVITYAPSSAPSNTNQGEISRLIIDKFGSASYYDITTAYGKAFDWITRDGYASEMINSQILGKLRRQNELTSFGLYERFFCGLFYFLMRGNRWVNCSATFDFHNETCEYIDRDYQLRSGRSTWLSDVSVCEWAGIICDNNEQIVVLDLNHLNLDGSIPAEIDKLQELQVLSLINNTIHGRIPSEIGNLAKLLDVDLHVNRLFGEIPKELYFLSKMLTFNLGYNYINGTIAPQIGNMRALKGFHLKENSLSGPIPKEIGDLADLHYLTLSGNSFTDLPSEFEQLTKLRSLFLDKNLFRGPLYLPVAEELEELSIDNNFFNNSLPGNLYKLKNLKYFIANNNEFTGEILPEIGGLTKLIVLQLRDNELEGSLPSTISNLFNLVTLRINYNSFTGEVPTSVCELYRDGKLQNFVADCKNDLMEGDLFYRNGTKEIKCACCTHCCDPGIESDCQPRDAKILQLWLQ